MPCYARQSPDLRHYARAWEREDGPLRTILITLECGAVHCLAKPRSAGVSSARLSMAGRWPAMMCLTGTSTKLIIGLVRPAVRGWDWTSTGTTLHGTAVISLAPPGMAVRGDDWPRKHYAMPGN